MDADPADLPGFDRRSILLFLPPSDDTRLGTRYLRTAHTASPFARFCGGRLAWEAQSGRGGREQRPCWISNWISSCAGSCGTVDPGLEEAS
jgi:hypothetical protein